MPNLQIPLRSEEELAGGMLFDLAEMCIRNLLSEVKLIETFGVKCVKTTDKHL